MGKRQSVVTAAVAAAAAAVAAVASVERDSVSPCRVRPHSPPGSPKRGAHASMASTAADGDAGSPLVLRRRGRGSNSPIARRSSPFSPHVTEADTHSPLDLGRSPSVPAVPALEGDRASPMLRRIVSALPASDGCIGPPAAARNKTQAPRYAAVQQIPGPDLESIVSQFCDMGFGREELVLGASAWRAGSARPETQGDSTEVAMADDRGGCPPQPVRPLKRSAGVGDIVRLSENVRCIKDACKAFHINASPLLARLGQQAEIVEVALMGLDGLGKIRIGGGEFFLCPMELLVQLSMAYVESEKLDALQDSGCCLDDAIDWFLQKRHLEMENTELLHKIKSVQSDKTTILDKTSKLEIENALLADRIWQLRRRCDGADSLQLSLTSARLSQSWLALARLPRLTKYTRTDSQILTEDDPRRYALEQLFVDSCVKHRRSLRGPQSDEWCDPPDLEVISIESVVNERLLRGYLARLEEMEGLRRKGCNPIEPLRHMEFPLEACEKRLNEVLLFHGAKLSSIDRILNGGFDPRRGGEGVGRLFGAATYLTPHASKADIYTESFDDRLPQNAHRKIIVVRAALGESFRTVHAMPSALRPPDGQDANPLDSVWADTLSHGGAVDHLECMVYDRGQTLPIAVVTYAHRWSCTCSECRKRGSDTRRRRRSRSSERQKKR